MTMVPECAPDLLRSLFLFEALPDDRLEYLCERGKVVRVEPGWLYREGEDATIGTGRLSRDALLGLT